MSKKTQHYKVMRLDDLQEAKEEDTTQGTQQEDDNALMGKHRHISQQQQQGAENSNKRPANGTPAATASSSSSGSIESKEHRVESVQLTTARFTVEVSQSREGEASSNNALKRQRAGTSTSVTASDVFADALKEHHEERQDRVERTRIIPRQLAAKSTDTKQMVEEVFTGSFLPLMNDKFRNNIRSRPLLAAVYGVGAAFVAMLVVVLFAVDTNSTWTMNFAVAPQSTIFIGVPMQPFMVQVLDADRRGVSNVSITVALIPLQNIDITVTLLRGYLFSHTINCPLSISEPFTGKASNLILCSPQGYNATWNYMMTTDAQGMAKFDDMLIGMASPGNYVLIAFGTNMSQKILSTTVTMRAHVESAQVTLPKSFVNVSSVLNASRWPPTYTFNFSLQIAWRTPSPPKVLCLGVMTLNLQDHFQKSVSVPTPLTDVVDKNADFSDPVICVWDDAIFPFGSNLSLAELSASSASSSSSSTDGSGEVGSTTGTIGSVFSRLTSLFFSSNAADVGGSSASSSDSVCSDCPLYTATVQSENIFLRGSNSREVFPGVFAMGTTLPLSAYLLDSLLQVPQQLILPFIVQNEDVARIVAEGLPTSIAEGEKWSNFSVKVYDSSGNEINRLAYVYLVPDPMHANAMAGAQVRSMIGIVNKRVLQDYFPTCPACDDDSLVQVTRWSELKPSVSVSGAVGRYRVFVAVDGFLAAWPDNGYATNLSVTVTSRVDLSKSILVWVGGIAEGLSELSVSHNETLGQLWQYIPLLRIQDSNGNDVVGKSFDIRPRDFTASGVTYASYGTAAGAFASIYSVTTTYRNGGEGPIIYDVIVDGINVTALSFTRYFLMPQNLPSNFRDICVYVVMLEYPSTFYSDLAAPMLLKTVALDGTPVANELVSMEAAQNLGLGTNFYTTTDATGYSWLNHTSAIPTLSGITGCFIALSCGENDDGSLSNWFGGVYQQRVTSVTASCPQHTRYCTISVDAQWDLVSAEAPIIVTANLPWSPSYVALWYDSSAFPQIGSVNITGSEMSTVRLSLTSESQNPGLYGLIPVVGTTPYNPFVSVQFEEVGLDNETQYCSDKLMWGLTLTLVQSAFTTAEINQSVAVFATLPQQPIVRLQYANGLPVVGVSVFVQPFVMMPDGSVVYSNTALDPAGLKNVLFTCLSPRFTKAVSNPSNASGYASFEGLTNVGGIVNQPIGIRYCVAQGVAMDPNDLSNTTSICVNDTGFGYIASKKKITYTISESSILGTPGQMLGNITITGTVEDGTPLPLVACVAFVDNYSQTPFQFDSSNLSIPYGTFFGGGSTLLLSQGAIGISPTALSDNHELFFVCQGGETNRIPLVITSAPYAIRFGLVPASPLWIRTVFAMAVVVTSRAGQPLNDVPIHLSFVRNQSCDGCLGYQLGSLYPTSTTMSLTNEYGIATFIVGIENGAQGNYSFTATVVSPFSQPVVQNTAGAGLRQILQDRGISFEQYVGNCNMSSEPPCDPTLVNVLNTLSAPSGGSNVFSGPIKNLISSVMTQTDVVSVSANVELFNPVASIVLLRDADITLAIPSARAIENNFVGAAPVTFQVPGHSWPKVRLLDVMGNPVSGAMLYVQTLPLNLQGVSLSFSSAMASDENGDAEVGSGNITVSGPISFQLLITASGGGGVTTAPITIINAGSFSKMDTMKLLAGMLVIFFSPMLASSVPHSRETYLMLGVVSALGSGVATVLLRSYVPDNDYVLGYYYFLVTAVFLLTACSLGLLVVHYFGECRNMPRFKVVNDEDRSRRIFLYSRWITNARVKRLQLMQQQQQQQQMVRGSSQTDLSGSPVAGASQEMHTFSRIGSSNSTNSISHPPTAATSTSTTGGAAGTTTTTIGTFSHPDNQRAAGDMSYEELLQALLPAEEAKKRKLDHMRQRARAKVASRLSAILDGNLFAETSDHDKDGNNRIRRDYSLRPTLQYPPEVELHLDPIYFPFNFLIVAAITVVLLIIEVFLLLYLYHLIWSASTLFLSYLPSVENERQITSANDLLVSLIVDGIGFCVVQFPSLYTLSKLIPAVRSVNVFSMLSQVHSTVNQLVTAVVILFSIAGVIATLGVAISLVLTARTIPRTIRQIRRGQLHVPHAIPSIEGYIGLHCMHNIIMHQLIFWLTVLFGCLMVVPFIRLAIYKTLLIFAAASLVSYLIQFVLQKIVVGWFLISGDSLVIRPELYALWHFVGLILGVFTGLMKSLVRWWFAVISMTALFSRLDQSIFPQSLLWLDQAHFGFMSVVALEAKNGNPLVLNFVMLLITEKELQHLAEEYFEEEQSAQLGERIRVMDQQAATAAAATENRPRRSTTIIRRPSVVSSRRTVRSGSTAITTANARPSSIISSSSSHNTNTSHLLRINDDDDDEHQSRGKLGSSSHYYQQQQSQQQQQSPVVVVGCTRKQPWEICCYHLFDRDFCLSAVVKNVARLYATHRYGVKDVSPSSESSEETTSDDAGVLPQGTDADEDAAAAAIRRHSTAGERSPTAMEFDAFKPLERRWIDLKPFYNGTNCRRSRQQRLQQRWWLWMMLTLNPSLRKERKHALYVVDAKPSLDQEESGRLPMNDEDSSSNNNNRDVVVGGVVVPNLGIVN